MMIVWICSACSDFRKSNLCVLLQVVTQCLWSAGVKAKMDSKQEFMFVFRRRKTPTVQDYDTRFQQVRLIGEATDRLFFIYKGVNGKYREVGEVTQWKTFLRK